MPTCNNCKHVFEGRYCSQCGQKASAARLSLHEVYHELVHSFTHADKGIIKLVKDLFVAPRRVYSGYFSGQRKTYFSPVTFFLLSIGLVIFANSILLHWDEHITGNKNVAEQLLSNYEKLRYLFFIPLIGLLTWALFYKRFNLAECLVFWFFCSGFIAVAELISYIPRFIFVQQRHSIAYYADWLVWLLIIVQIFAAFYNRTVSAALRCILLAIAAYLVLVYVYKLLAYWKGLAVDFNFWQLMRDVFG